MTDIWENPGITECVTDAWTDERTDGRTDGKFCDYLVFRYRGTQLMLKRGKTSPEQIFGYFTVFKMVGGGCCVLLCDLVN